MGRTAPLLAPELVSEPEAGAPGSPEAGASDAGGDPETPMPSPDDPEAPSGSAEEPGPGRALTDAELLEAVTVLVFASPEPLSTGRLGKLLEGPEATRVKAALEQLGQKLAASGLPLELRSIAGGWQILTAPRMAEVVGRLQADRKVERISPAALETLAIVAYRQPVTKAEIEAIRGVQVGPILRSLVDRGLVRVAGRSDQPGHPLEYGTTRDFLDRFGLASLEDLPRDGELASD